jgi:hypothetical protein
MKDKLTVNIHHLPDDPLCMRASIGGKSEAGFYLMFRGNQREVLAMLKLATMALSVCEELEIEEDTPTIGRS